MAKDETVKNEEIETVSTEENTGGSDQASTEPSSTSKEIQKALSPYVAFLEGMRTIKPHIDTAPTFTPKNFFEQIQFYDDGANYRIYIYINGDWRYVALT